MIYASKCQLPFSPATTPDFFPHLRIPILNSEQMTDSAVQEARTLSSNGWGCILGTAPILFQKFDKIWKKWTDFLALYISVSIFSPRKTRPFTEEIWAFFRNTFSVSQRLPPGPRKICPFRRKRIAVLCEKRYNITEDTAPMRAPPAHSAKKGESQQYG